MFIAVVFVKPELAAHVSQLLVTKVHELLTESHLVVRVDAAVNLADAGQLEVALVLETGFIFKEPVCWVGLTLRALKNRPLIVDFGVLCALHFLAEGAVFKPALLAIGADLIRALRRATIIGSRQAALLLVDLVVVGRELDACFFAAAIARLLPALICVGRIAKVELTVVILAMFGVLVVVVGAGQVAPVLLLADVDVARCQLVTRHAPIHPTLLSVVCVGIALEVLTGFLSDVRITRFVGKARAVLAFLFVPVVTEEKVCRALFKVSADADLLPAVVSGFVLALEVLAGGLSAGGLLILVIFWALFGGPLAVPALDQNRTGVLRVAARAALNPTIGSVISLTFLHFASLGTLVGRFFGIESLKGNTVLTLLVGPLVFAPVGPDVALSLLTGLTKFIPALLSAFHVALAVLTLGRLVTSVHLTFGLVPRAVNRPPFPARTFKAVICGARLNPTLVNALHIAGVVLASWLSLRALIEILAVADN